AEVEVTTVELREYAHDITDALLTRFPGERLAIVIEQVRAADAVIAVTPVFNVGPSGLFKMFFDALAMARGRGKALRLGAAAGTRRAAGPLPRRAARDRARAGARRRRRDRSDARVQRGPLGAVQDVLRRAGHGAVEGQTAAARRDRRHRPALARDRLRDPPDV